MSILSLNDSSIYKSGNATVKNAEVENNKVTIWFELENDKIVRESYRLSKSVEKEKLKSAVKVLLGSIPLEFDIKTMIDLPCYVQLEERPWTKGRTWTGVAEVEPFREEINTASSGNDSKKITEPISKKTSISTLFDDDSKE